MPDKLLRAHDCVFTFEKNIYKYYQSGITNVCL